MALIPGVPQLPAGTITPAIAGVASQAIAALLWDSSQSPDVWGVFDSGGNRVVFPDSILEFSDRQEYEVSNYPVQDGSFASYNKVIRPEEIQLRFIKTSTLDERAAFLASIKAIVASILLYTVVTPEAVYPSMNAERREVSRRGPKGAYQLTEVDVYFIQIIQVQAQYTTTAVQLPNAQEDDAKPTSNAGNVQPGEPDSQLSQDGQTALDTAASGPPGSY